LKEITRRFVCKRDWIIAMTPEMEFVHRRMQEVFGDRISHLACTLQHFAETMQMFDATFYDREPILDVTLRRDWARAFCAALMFRKESRHLANLLERVTFSDGTAVDWNKIWTINYMPAELNTAGVDLAKGDDVIGLNGETVREMIRHTYHCESRAEEDFFLARWIAS
jgi:hypothetical protein